MSKKKEQIEEIEKNLLVGWFEERFGYLKPYYKTIGVVACLLVLGTLLFGILAKLNYENNASQWNELNLSLTNTNADGNTVHLSDMAEQNANAPAGLWALQIAGDIELQSGLRAITTNRDTAMKKVEKARDNYLAIVESSVKKTPMLQERSVYGLAYAEESLGNWESANGYYAQLLDAVPDSQFADAAQRGLARTKDDNLIAFYDDFQTKEMSVAPGMSLPDRPDISFPEFDMGDEPGGGDFNPDKKVGLETGDADNKGLESVDVNLESLGDGDLEVSEEESVEKVEGSTAGFFPHLFFC